MKNLPLGLNPESCYCYDLPDDRIAQRPILPPSSARLLVAVPEAPLSDMSFIDLPTLLRPNDLLIFNNTRVIPVRLFGEIESGRRVEVFLIREISSLRWTAMGKPLKALRPGTRILVYGNLLELTVISRTGEMELEVELHPLQDKDVTEILQLVGTMPIPPYIRGGVGDDQDKQDYQTIFARNAGSIAAPTASLHFDPELIGRLDDVGIEKAEITLHVGVASVLPIWREGQSSNLSRPAGERCYVPPDTIAKIERCRKRGGRVVAVGTTVVRALEGAALDNSLLSESKTFQETEIFITPGHRFANVDVIITNFHQPRSTHLLLIEAFIGRERLDTIYSHALSQQYRFLSYGDGMILFR